MKRIFILTLTALIIFSFNSISFAKSSYDEQQFSDVKNADIISNSQFEISTSKDELFRSQIKDLYQGLELNYNDVPYEKNKTGPVKIIQANYANGVCYLDLYDNGSFDVYGVEFISEENSIKSSGYTTSGSGYKSYYRSAIYGFSYTYKVSTNTSTHLSTISNKGGFTQFGTQYGYFSLNSLTYTRTKQTSTKPAELVGKATLYSDGYNTGAIYKLITRVTSGTISVTLNVGS